MSRHVLKAGAVAAVVAAIVYGWMASAGAYATYGKWPTASATVYVNPANSDGLSDSAVVSALQAAMNDWNTQGASPFRFNYGGVVRDTSTQLDNRNLVLFRNESNGGTIAYTYSWWDSSNRLLDSDMIIYDQGYTFFAFDGTCNPNIGYGVYLHDLTTHEFGHMLGLSHSDVPTATMHAGYAGCSTDQRSLDADDIAGIQSLYGRSSSSPPSNSAPTVSISSPGNGASYAAGSTVGFSGSASDAQDGTLTGSLTWTSNIDGAIGSGGGFNRTLSAGTHVITASVRDSGGLTGSSQVTVAVAAAVALVASADGTMVPTTAPQIVDNSGAVWTIGSDSSIRRNGVQAGGGWGSRIYWKNSAIYVYGGDNNWWQWTGSTWSNVGPNTPGGGTAAGGSSGTSASPDGTMVPTTAPQIVDNSGAVWTIGSDSSIRRNGVQVGGGWGTRIYWKNSTIYVYGGDNNWWQWTGSTWTNVGANTPGGGTSASGGSSGTSASPDGTIVPTTAPQIVDNSGAVWTIGSDSSIRRNGVQVGGGSGSRIYWKNSTIYAYGTDGNWWQWTGSTWSNVGPNTPGGGTTASGGSSGTSASPDGTMVPATASQIVDNTGAVWTIGSNQSIRRNGVQFGSAAGSKIYWKNTTIFVYGIDFNWWRFVAPWTDSSWLNIGPNQP
jgi:hypothetical protein